MLGYVPIGVVLPLLLIASIAIGFFIIGFRFILIISELSCRKCGMTFPDEEHLRLHRAEHEPWVVRLPERMEKAESSKAA